jgi:U3 small nucleolar RNA-associated protein 6
MHVYGTTLTVSALQHHPLSPTLYLLLSYHHLHPASPFPRDILPDTATSSTRAERESRDAGFSLEGTSAARTQLLLGLRMIPDSTELWTEYIKLELGWVEALRRRWNVLGIHDELDVQANDGVEAERLTGGEGSFGPDGEDARKAILAGKLVLQAISSALEAISVSEQGLEFGLGLVEMLRRYPSALRGKCLDAVFDDLHQSENNAELDAEIRAEARLAITTRRLYETKYVAGEEYRGLEGVELVEELGKVGKEIRKAAKGDAAFCDVGGRWLADQVQLHQDDEELVR